MVDIVVVWLFMSEGGWVDRFAPLAKHSFSPTCLKKVLQPIIKQQKEQNSEFAHSFHVYVSSQQLVSLTNCGNRISWSSLWYGQAFLQKNYILPSGYAHPEFPISTTMYIAIGNQFKAVTNGPQNKRHL